MEHFILLNFSFGLGAVIIGVVAFIMLNLGLVIFLGSKDLISRTFALMTFAVVLWSVNHAFLVSAVSTSYLGDILNRFSYVLGLCNILVLSYVCVVQSLKKREPFVAIMYFCILFGFTILLMATDYIRTDSLWVGTVSWAGVQMWASGNGPWYLSYYIFYAAVIVYGLYLLRTNAKREQDALRKKQLLDMFWIVIIGVIPPTVTSIVLPTFFHISSFDWIGAVTGVFWLATTSYFLMRKNQTEQVFPVRIVYAELLVIAMIFLFGIGMFY
jgi:hypothetical protein